MRKILLRYPVADDCRFDENDLEVLDAICGIIVNKVKGLSFCHCPQDREDVTAYILGWCVERYEENRDKGLAWWSKATQCRIIDYSRRLYRSERKEAAYAKAMSRDRARKRPNREVNEVFQSFVNGGSGSPRSCPNSEFDLLVAQVEADITLAGLDPELFRELVAGTAINYSTISKAEIAEKRDRITEMKRFLTEYFSIRNDVVSDCSRLTLDESYSQEELDQNFAFAC